MSRTSKNISDVELGIEQSSALTVVTRSVPAMTPATLPEQTWGEKLTGPMALASRAEDLPVKEQKEWLFDAAENSEELDEKKQRVLDSFVELVRQECDLSVAEREECKQQAVVLRSVPESPTYISPYPGYDRTAPSSTFSIEVQNKEWQVISEIMENARLAKLVTAFKPPSPLLVRYATLLADDGVPEVRAVSAIFEVLGAATAINDVFTITRNGLRALREQRGPARPAFFSDETDRMADYAQSQWERQYPQSAPLGNGSIPKQVTSGFIEEVLGPCDVRDREGKLVKFDNRLVTEIRGSLERRFWRVSFKEKNGRDADGEQKTLTSSGMPALSSPKQTHAAIFGELFVVDEKTWTETKLLHAAYVAECERREVATASEKVFGAMIKKWGGDGVKRSQKQKKWGYPVRLLRA